MSLRRSASPLIAVLMAALALCGSAVAQEGNPPPVGNLTAKYKLVERYTTQDSKPGFVSQYQVAFEETFTASKPGGYTARVQFTERAAAAPDDRRPVEVVRHYHSVDIQTQSKKEKPGPPILNNLTLWIRELPEKPPLMISLTPNRSLLENEYDIAATHDFVTRLTYVLSNDAIRKGDTWKVSSAGNRALTGLMNIVSGSLTGKLIDVRAHPSGVGQQAVIEITGSLEENPERLGDNETKLNAQLLFAFTPSPAADGGNVIEGFGAIENVRLGQVRTIVDPATDKKSWIKRELVLERRIPGQPPLLTVPEPPPTPTTENSWLIAASANGEYYFRHPQDFDFKLNRPQGKDAAFVTAVLSRPISVNLPPDLITFDYYGSTVLPQAAFEQLKANWKAEKVEVTPGLARRLPDAEWPDMAVHFMEAMLKMTPQAADIPLPRRYSYNYVIQFPRNVSIIATANTFSDKPEQFHSLAEAILKTLKLGPVPTQ